MGMLRRLIDASGRGWALTTAWRRPLPDFVVIGVQRGGSSAFFAGLRHHPQVRSSSVKEVHYFDYHHRRGSGWYRSFFPMATEGTLVGEATPNYLFHPHASGWVAETLPSAKLIVLLRDPVGRAHSAWKLMRRLGHEELSFEEAIAAEPERIGPDRARLDADPDHRAYPFFRYSYLSRGHYAEQLEPWLAVFGDRLLILRSEDFYRDQPVVLETASRFLGLADHRFAPAEGAINAAPEGSGSMAPETRSRLEEYYTSHNRRLEELLGRRFDW